MLLKIKNLNVDLKDQYSILQNIDLEIKTGEKLAIVGESGSGKTTLIKAIMDLLPTSISINKGNIYFKNQDLLELKSKDRRKINGKNIGLISQNPTTALDPMKTIFSQIKEAITIHNKEVNIKEKINELLNKVAIKDIQKIIGKYPHELSGGQKQRINIAIALANDPEVLICDEPTTALDASVQKEILKLLSNLNSQNCQTIILVTHDIAVASYLTDKICVMYEGEMVEYGATKEVLSNPYHPYTKGLLEAVITPNMKKAKIKTIKGSVLPINKRKTNCLFYNRCPLANEKCLEKKVALFEQDNRKVRCIYGKNKDDN